MAASGTIEDASVGPPAPSNTRWARALDRLQMWLGASPALRQWWRIVIVTIGILASVVRRRMNAILELLHEPGERSFGVSALGAGRGTANAALAAWEAGATSFGDLIAVSKGTVLGVHLVSSSIFMVCLSASAIFLIAIQLDQMKRKDELSITRQQVLRRMLTGAAMAAIALAVVDIVENILMAVVAAGGESVALVLPVFRYKVLLGALTAIPIGVAAWNMRGRRTRRHWQPAPGPGALFKVQVAIVAAFVLLSTFGFTAAQTQDAIRFWDEDVSHLLFALVGLLVFGVTIAISAGRLSRVNTPKKDLDPAILLILGITLVLGGTVANLFPVIGRGVAALGIVLTAIGVTSIPIAEHWRKVREEEAVALEESSAEQEKASNRPRVLIRLLAVSPTLAALAAVIDGALRDWAAGTSSLLVLVHAVLLLAVAGAIFAITRSKTGERIMYTRGGSWSKRAIALMVYCLTLVLIIMFGIWFAPLPVAGLVGTVGIIALAFAGFTVAVSAGGWITETYRTPAAFGFLGARRFPVLTILLAWILVGAMIDTDQSQSDVRVLERTPTELAEEALAPEGDAEENETETEGAKPAITTPARQLAQWAATNSTEGEQALPLVLIATHGGGLKAATWSALVIDCAMGDGADPSCPARSNEPWANFDRWFAGSGASGGSVGLASITAQRLDEAGDPPPSADDTRGPFLEDRSLDPNSVAGRLTGDFLSPSLGWQLFAEAPLSFVRGTVNADRAEQLEEAWAERWEPDTEDDSSSTANRNECVDGNPATTDFFALPFNDSTNPDCNVPLLFLNGADLASGCFVNVSPLDADEALRTTPIGDADAPPRQAPCDDSPFGAGDGLELGAGVDIQDYLCPDESLRLATAAFLSARFPFVSPAGRLESPANRASSTCGPDAQGPQGEDGDEQGGPVALDLNTLYIGDHGYRDNSGTSALADLLASLSPYLSEPELLQDLTDQEFETPSCIVPILIEVRSGFGEESPVSAGPRVFQGLAPVQGALSVFGSRDRADQDRLAAFFTRGLLPDGSRAEVAGQPATRYFNFDLRSHPGVEAPLGWLLSEESVKGLIGQLQQGRNRLNFEALGTVLEPGQLSCVDG